MTNTAPTSDAIAWQRIGRVTGVAGLAAVVLILVPMVVGTRSVRSFRGGPGIAPPRPMSS
jgi:hypothetical protein